MLTQLLSIFILIASGYGAKKFKVFEQKNANVFINYALCFALPALIFDKIYHVNIDTTLINVIATGFCCSVIGAVAIFFVCKFLKFNKATTVSAVLLGMFGNTIFMGMPIIEGFFGIESMNEVIFYDQLATSIPISIFGPFILAFGAPAKVSLIQNVIKVIKFPPFVALILGFLLRGVPLPQVIFDSLNLFAKSVVPVALFAIGIGLGFRSIKSAYKSTAVVIIGKMLIAPLIFIFFMLIFRIDFTQTWMIGILQCAMPPMVLASAMIMKAELDSQLAVSAVAVGVGFSFINLPLLSFIFSLF
ncbi:MAG: AEC family transporter [Campylobacter sp.]